MSTRRSSQLTIAFAPDWLRQSAWDVPIDAADITAAFPATSRNYLDVDETVEDVQDCTGEDFLFEVITKRLARLNIEFDVDPDVLAGVTAFLYGVAAAPSGGTNEVQTLTITATGGTYTLVVTRGADSQITAPLAFNANQAAIQAAINALPNVNAGDITVGGAGPFTFTFGATLGLQDVATIVPNTFALTGGTATMVETTDGVGQTHNITRIANYTLPLLTLYIGFRGSDKQPVIFKNVVVNDLRVRGTHGAKVTATMSLIGSAVLADATGFTMPGCLDILPIRFGDCGMLIGGVDYIANALGREFEFFYQNNVVPQFDGASIDITRAERADRRPSGFNFFVLGEPGDATDLLAKNKTTLPVALRIGPPNRSITYSAPQGLLRRATAPIRFGGDPLESELALVVRPRKISGISATPTNAVAVTAQATPFLTSD